MSVWGLSPLWMVTGCVRAAASCQAAEMGAREERIV